MHKVVSFRLENCKGYRRLELRALRYGVGNCCESSFGYGEGLKWLSVPSRNNVKGAEGYLLAIVAPKMGRKDAPALCIRSPVSHCIMVARRN